MIAGFGLCQRMLFLDQRSRAQFLRQDVHELKSGLPIRAVAKQVEQFDCHSLPNRATCVVTSAQIQGPGALFGVFARTGFYPCLSTPHLLEELLPPLQLGRAALGSPARAGAWGEALQ